MKTSNKLAALCSLIIVFDHLAQLNYFPVFRDRKSHEHLTEVLLLAVAVLTMITLFHFGSPERKKNRLLLLWIPMTLYGVGLLFFSALVEMAWH